MPEEVEDVGFDRQMEAALAAKFRYAEGQGFSSQRKLQLLPTRGQAGNSGSHSCDSIPSRPGTANPFPSSAGPGCGDIGAELDACGSQARFPALCLLAWTLA
eukprot:gb/GFBE01079478.1/.p1 GENE.gb/GFBE01079478.1/~~gb/GFBE01079478.1/.p1  ORF type:complete len:102 (+),score=12.11 gb/GFBE01079478.1/:1-306(+)